MKRALWFLALAACQTATPGGGEAPLPRAVELRDDHGETVFTATRTATGCVIDAPDLTATTADGVTRAGDWQVGPDPSGRVIQGPNGPIARLVDEPRRFSILDPAGVPLARIALDDDRAATVLDSGRAPIGRLEATEDGARLLDTERRHRGSIQGSADLRLAAVLAAVPELPTAARALYACDHLLSDLVPAK